MFLTIAKTKAHAAGFGRKFGFKNFVSVYSFNNAMPIVGYTNANLDPCLLQALSQQWMASGTVLTSLNGIFDQIRQ